MCRSSAITIGCSAAAILRLRSPEEEEPDYQGKHRPGYPVDPVVGRVGDWVAVRAPVQRLLQVLPGVTLQLVGRHGARLALALRREHCLADQRDVDRGRVDLQQ